MNDVAKPKSIEDALIEKVRAGLGELVPEDVLKAMVDKALDKLLFEKREYRDSYGRVQEVRDSSFVKAVHDELRTGLEAQVKQALQSREAEIAKIIEDYIRDKVPQIIGTCIAQLMQGNAYALQTMISTMTLPR